MSLIKFTIPDPCHENWQNMTPTEQGRFCGSCQKDVIDFSRINDKEVYDILLRQGADVCGRFSPEQFDAGIKYGVKKKMYWHKYFVSFFFPAFLFSKQSNAQMGKIAKHHLVVHPSGQEKFIIKQSERSFELSGRILDAETNERLAYATIASKGGENSVVASDSGFFKLTSTVNGSTARVRITAIGYEPAEMEIAVPETDFVLSEETFYLKKQVIKLDTVMLHSTSNFLTGSLGGIMMSVKVNRFTELPKRLMTAISDSIKIFPNPVKRGNNFNLNLKLKKGGTLSIQIIDLSGRIVHHQSINVADKKYTAQLTCGSNWNAGVYMIRTINAAGKVIDTSRFVVE